MPGPLLNDPAPCDCGSVGDLCPDAHTISCFLRDGLDVPRCQVVEGHLDGCRDCAQVVADMVRIFDEDSKAQSASTERGR